MNYSNKDIYWYGQKISIPREYKGCFVDYLYQSETEKEKQMDYKTKKKLLVMSDAEKAAYKLGWVDEDGELTDEGRKALVDLMFERDGELISAFYEYAEEMADGE